MAFAKARRHTMHVRALRVGIVASGLAMTAALALVAAYDPFGRHAGALSIGKVEVDGTRVAMGQPVLSGYGRDGKPYVLRAAKAIQDSTKPGKVELEGIDAELDGGDSSAVHMTAKNGLYESQAERMDVSGDVHLTNASYTVALKTAKLDFKASRYSSSDPVFVTIKGGTEISADAVSATDAGKTLTFLGRVHSKMTPETPGDADKEPQ